MYLRWSKRILASTWAGAQRFHNGGMPGLSPGEVPAILRRGEVVIPEGGMRGAGGVSVSVPISIDASGADPEAIRRLNESVDKMKAEIPAQVVASVRRATKSNIKLGG